MAFNVASLNARLTADTSNLEQGLRRSQQSLQDTANSARSTGNIMQGALSVAIGSLAAMAVPAFGAMAASAVSAGANFGSIVNKIQAVSGESAAAMEEVRAKALQLGQDLPVSASTAAEGILELVAGGMSLNAALTASTGVTQLAAAHMMGVGDAAAIVSATLNSFKMAADQSGAAADILSQIANASAASISDVGETMKYAGGVAGSLSQPLSDVGAAIGLMANQSIKGSQAGTSLRAILTELAAPGDATAATLQQLGISVFDAGGKMLPFMDIAQQFRTSMEGMTDAQRTQIAQTVAGTPGMAGFLAILNAAPEQFDGMRASMENASGATQKFMDATSQGFGFQWEQLQGSIETVLIQGFQAVEPILNKVAVAATQVVNNIGSALTTAKPQIDSFVSALANIGSGNLGTATAGLLNKLGLDTDAASQVGAIIDQVVGAVQSGINAVKSAIAGFQTGGVSGLLTGLGLDSSTAATVAGVMNQIGGVIQGGIDRVKTAVSGFQTGGVSGLLVGLGLDPAVAASVGALMDSIANAVMTGASIVSSALTALTPYAPMLAGALSVVANIAGGLLVGALNILAGVINFVTQHWQLFASIIAAVGAALAGSAIIGAITTLMSILGGLGAIVASAGGVMGTLTTIMGLVAGAIALPIAPIAILIGIIGGLAVAWTTNLGGIQEKTAEVVARVGASFEQLGGVAGALWDALGRAAQGDFSGAWSGFQERVGEVNATYQAKLQEIDSGTSATVDNVKSSIQSGMSGLSDIVGNAFSGVTSMISSFMSKAVGDTAAKADQIKGILASLQGSVAASNIGMTEDIIGGSADIARINNTNAKLTEIRKSVASTGGIAGGIGGAAKSAEDKIKEAADALNRVTDLVKSIGEMLKSGLDGLTVGDGADQVVQVAAQLAQVGRRIADAFAAASAGLKDDSYKAAQELSSGISASSQALSSVIGLLPKLWEFVNSSAWGEMQGSLGDLLGVAGQLAQWGRGLFDVFSAAAQGVSEEAAKASQILSQGISAAASGIGAVIGLLPKLWEFVNSPMFDAIMDAKSELISAAAKISQFGRALFEVFAEVAQGVNEDAVKAAQLLSQGITAATSAISATIDTVKKLIDFIYGFDTQMALTDEGRAIILSATEKLSELGRDILDAFAQAAAGLSGKTVAAAQRLAAGIEASMGALNQTADTVRKLINLFYDIDTRQIVAAEAQGHLAVQHIAMRLIGIGRNALLNFARAGEGIRGQTIVAAKVMADGIGGAMGALGTVADSVRKLINLFYDIDTRQVVAAEAQGHLAVQHIAMRLIGIGRESLLNFARAGEGLRAGTLAGAKAMADGIAGAMGALGQIADIIPKLINLFYDIDTRQIVAAEAQGHLAVQHIAMRLIGLGQFIVSEMGAAAQSLSYFAPSGTRILSEAIGQAADALLKLTDLLPRLVAIMTDTATASTVAGSSGMAAVQAVASRLVALGAAIVNEFAVAANTLLYTAPSAARILGEAIVKSTEAVTRVVDLVNLMTTGLSFDPNQLNTEAIKTVAGHLIDLGRDLANHMAGAANTLNASVGNIKTLAEATNAVAGALSAMMGFVDRLLVFVSDRLAYAIATGPNAREWVRGFATNLGQLSVAIVEGFGSVAGDLSGSASASAKTLGEAIQSVLAPMISLMDFVDRFLTFVADSTAYALATGPNARLWIASFATNLGQLSVEITNSFGRVAVDLDSVAAGAARRLGEAVQNVLGSLMGLMDWVTRFTLFASDRFAYATATSDAARIQARAFADKLALLGSELVQAFGVVGADLSENVSTAADRLANAMNTTIGALEKGLGLIGLMGQVLRAEADIPYMGEGSPYVQALQNLVRFAGEVVRAAQAGLNSVTLLASGPLSTLKDALDAVTGVFSGVFSAIDIILKGQIPGAVSFANLDAGETASPFQLKIMSLVGIAQGIIDAASRALSVVTVMANGPLSQLNEALGSALGVLQGAFDAIKLLASDAAISADASFANLAAGETASPYQLRIMSLVTFAHGIADTAARALAGLETTESGPLSDLASVIGDALGVLQGALDGIKLLAERVDIPDISPLTQAGQDLRRYITTLAQFGQQVTEVVRDAVTSFTISKDPAITTLAGVVGDGMTILSSALDGIKLLAERVQIPDISELTVAGRDLRTYITALAQFGQSVTEVVRDAVALFTIGKDPAISSLSGVIGDGLTILQTSLDTIKSVRERMAIPSLDDLDSLGVTLRDYIKGLAGFGQQVTEVIRDTVTSFSIGEDPGIGKLSGVIGDGLTILQTSLDLIKTLAERVEIPDISPLTQAGQGLRRYIETLAKFGQSATEVVRDAVTSFSIGENSGLGQLSAVVGDGLSILQNSLDLIKTLTNRVTVPSLDDLDDKGESLRQYITRLAQFARDITAQVRNAVEGFSIAKDSGLSQLAPTVGDALSVLTDGLDITKLIDKILNFRGVNWQTVGPKLDLLLKDIVEIARRFAKSAADAGIPEAFAEAGSQVASLFGDAAGALNDAIELGVKLLDPETVVPSISQVDSKLNGLLTLITEVVNRFANKAASIGGDKITAAGGFGDAISSVFEGISKAADAIQNFQGIYTGSSGLNNIRESLRLLFDTFEEFGDRATNVNAVTAAITSVLGGLTALSGIEGLAAGVSWGTQFAAGLRSVADDIQAAFAESVNPGGGVGSNSGGTAVVGSNSGGTAVVGGNSGGVNAQVYVSEGGRYVEKEMNIYVTQIASESELRQSAGSLAALDALYGA